MILIFMSTGGAAGEYYQYRDDNGILHFTDDGAVVPEANRQNVKAFESLDASRTLRAAAKKSPEYQTKPAASPYTWDGRLRMAVESLDRESLKLHRAFRELQRQETELRQDDPAKMTPRERQAHRERIEALNERIVRYRHQKKAFQESVEKFESRF